jgi:hypothetical protein
MPEVPDDDYPEFIRRLREQARARERFEGDLLAAWDAWRAKA